MSATAIADLSAGGKRLGPKLGQTLYDCLHAKNKA